MTTVITAGNGQDFLALLPRLTGYTPSNSVVIVAFRGRRTCGAIRFDLPVPASLAALRRTATAMLGMACRIPDVDAVVTVAYTDDEIGASDVLPHAEFLDVLVHRAEVAGLHVRDSLCVAADGWASYLDPAVPPRGRPLAEIAASPVNALADAAGLAPGDDPTGAVGLPSVDAAMRAAVERRLAVLVGGMPGGSSVTSPVGAPGPATGESPVGTRGLAAEARPVGSPGRATGESLAGARGLAPGESLAGAHGLAPGESPVGAPGGSPGGPLGASPVGSPGASPVGSPAASPDGSPRCDAEVPALPRVRGGVVGRFEQVLGRPPEQIGAEERALLLHVLLRPYLRDVALLQWAFGRETGVLALRESRTFLVEGTVDRHGASALMWGEGPRPDVDRIDRAMELLAVLAASAPSSMAAPPLSMLGWLSWALGAGSRAHAFCALAAELDPDYGLAALITTMVESGRLPDWAFEVPPVDESTVRRVGAPPSAG